MPLTTDEIDRIASLARLRLTAEERRTLPEQLREIVVFVDRLEGFEADLGDDGGEAPSSSAEAEDVPAAGLPRGEVLANAPPASHGPGHRSASGEGPGSREPDPPEGFFVVPEVR